MGGCFEKCFSLQENSGNQFVLWNSFMRRLMFFSSFKITFSWWKSITKPPGKGSIFLQLPCIGLSWPLTFRHLLGVASHLLLPECKQNTSCLQKSCACVKTTVNQPSNLGTLESLDPSTKKYHPGENFSASKKLSVWKGTVLFKGTTEPSLVAGEQPSYLPHWFIWEGWTDYT